MNLIGRYQGVRGWNGRDFTAPFIIDRKWGRLTPMVGDEWWRSPEGIWVPTVAGGIGFQGAHRAMRLTFPTPGSTFVAPTLNTTALSNAYTNGSAGNSIAGRFVWPATLTLSSIYFFIISYTGAAGSVTTINWEVRSGTGSSPTNTAPGLVASGTVNPASALGWIVAATAQSITFTGGTFYWIIIADADGNGTNFANVNNRTTTWPTSAFLAWIDYMAATTANGWSTVGSQTGTPGIVAGFSDGTTLGHPYTAIANSSNTTNRKGFYFSTGINSRLSVYGLISSASNANLSGAEVYIGNSTVPGTGAITPTQTAAKDQNAVNVGFLFAPSYIIPSLTPFRIVFTLGGATTRPQQLNIGTGTDATLRSSGIGGGSIYWAEANGTTNWSNDDTNAFPSALLLVDDQMQSQVYVVNE